ncbi:FAD/NAD(P)-binding domain-containing protein [Linnemannia elongata AG-77]|uniref:FAD/NAD(P)-binding domain-containing protein n=1 Tax=Linnemannia elongata AG-77 TaxID=1314771 RepID=A0A197JVX7_9FUNG|nr:FAD/NAD(P)-binding domain-containing protein [Linnemannia elongata AG-77]
MSTPTVNKSHSSLPSVGFKGSDLPPLVTDDPPRVLIAGAGLGGLFLGIFLERAGIPYEIFERTSEIRPLGSIICLSPNILPAFEQLGLYDELMSFSKPALRNTFFTGDLKVIGKTSTLTTDTVGYDRILMARPDLYNMLYKLIPPHKIHLSKKVFSFQQNHEGVMLRFSDNTTVHGDILVGADGAHSAVRQHLHKTLDKQGLLSKADTKAMNKGYISLVGTTDELDPAKYPGALEEDSESFYIIGDKKTPYTWVTFFVPGNKICWSVIIQIGIAEIADEQFKSSDWVPQQNQKMLDSIRHFKTPYGTMGDLFDVTPIERVSKVYFEDMLFETWNHGRTVLIGDAAHKLLPSSGAGAVNAMQDAVLLANHIYDIKPTSFENIKRALCDYKEERFDAIKDQYPQSYVAAKLIYGHTFSERALRQVVFNWMPKSMQMKQLLKDTAYRPQANFLPPAPKRGTMDTIPQKPSRRIREEAEAAKNKATDAVVSL